MAYDALSMAAAGSSSRAPSSLRMLLAGLAVGPPLRHASLHSRTSAAACSTYSNSGHSPHSGSPDYEAPDSEALDHAMHTCIPSKSRLYNCKTQDTC